MLAGEGLPIIQHWGMVATECDRSDAPLVDCYSIPLQEHQPDSSQACHHTAKPAPHRMARGRSTQRPRSREPVSMPLQFHWMFTEVAAYLSCMCGRLGGGRPGKRVGSGGGR